MTANPTKRWTCGLVALALSLCAALSLVHAARAGSALQVICAIEYGDPGTGAYRQRPHECQFHERGQPVAYANLVAMRSIHWSHWGPRVAIGRGKFLANMVGPTPGRV